MRDVIRHVDDEFYSARRSNQVPFVINDPVDIHSGLCAGRGGAVIAIESVEPELVLLVAWSDGTDVRVPARALRLTGTAGEGSRSPPT